MGQVTVEPLPGLVLLAALEQNPPAEIIHFGNIGIIFEGAVQILDHCIDRFRVFGVERFLVPLLGGIEFFFEHVIKPQVHVGQGGQPVRLRVGPKALRVTSIAFAMLPIW